MTAFSTTQVPASVDTLEKLAVWAAFILQDLNFDSTIIEQTNGQAIPVASITPFNLRSTDFNGIRYIARISLPVATNYASQAEPWSGVSELSTATIPAAYTT